VKKAKEHKATNSFFSSLFFLILLFRDREMLISALRTMVKEINIVISHWNLCIQLLKSLKNGIFNLRLSLFGFLNHYPKSIG